VRPYAYYVGFRFLRNHLENNELPIFLCGKIWPQSFAAASLFAKPLKQTTRVEFSYVVKLLQDYPAEFLREVFLRLYQAVLFLQKNKNIFMRLRSLHFFLHIGNHHFQAT